MATLTEEYIREHEISLSGRSRTRQWCYEADSPLEDPGQILRHPDLPRLGAVFISFQGGLIDPFLRCQRLRCVSREGSNRIHTVTAEYASQPAEPLSGSTDPAESLSGVSIPVTSDGLSYGTVGGGGSAGGSQPGGGEASPAEGTVQENPLRRPIKVSFGVEEVLEIVDKDQDAPNVKILNSAGAAFDPPIEEPTPILVMTMTRNLPGFAPLVAAAAFNAANLNDWIGFPAGTVCIGAITGDGPEIENGVSYWSVKSTVRIRLGRGWKRRVLDAGYYYIEEGVKKRFTDGFGNALGGLGLLNGAGGKLADGADPVYLQFWTKSRIDFKAVFGF